jgi:hypothetical protein
MHLPRRVRRCVSGMLRSSETSVSTICVTTDALYLALEGPNGLAQRYCILGYSAHVRVVNRFLVLFVSVDFLSHSKKSGNTALSRSPFAHLFMHKQVRNGIALLNSLLINLK